MRELLNALESLERLGASWKARRVTKTAPYDTIECTSLVQTSEGVIRGLVEVRRGQTYSQTKAEVACYLDGKLGDKKDKGEFKHLSHPKAKTTKLYEYENTILMRYSTGFFGVGRGFRHAGAVPLEHQYLTDFAERLMAKFDCEKLELEPAKAAEDGARKNANEAKARKALFG